MSWDRSERDDSMAAPNAAGGAEAFFERYAVILHSDHGQTPVAEAAQLVS